MPTAGVMKDVVLLGIYSHMIDSFLYLPDYPIGHMIAFQIEDQMKKAGSIGTEFERMAKMGAVTPDLWMEHATGQPVGAVAGEDDEERAVARLAALRIVLRQVAMGKAHLAARHLDELIGEILHP